MIEFCDLEPPPLVDISIPWFVLLKVLKNGNNKLFLTLQERKEHKFQIVGCKDMRTGGGI